MAGQISLPPDILASDPGYHRKDYGEQTDQDGPAAFPRAVILKGAEDRSVSDRFSVPFFISLTVSRISGALPPVRRDFLRCVD